MTNQKDALLHTTGTAVIAVGIRGQIEHVGGRVSDRRASGGSGHFQEVRVQKVTRKKVFARASGLSGRPVNGCVTSTPAQGVAAC